MPALSGSSEVTTAGSASGLLVDWLDLLDPEVTSICPDIQQKLLFALNKVTPLGEDAMHDLIPGDLTCDEHLTPGLSAAG